MENNNEEGKLSIIPKLATLDHVAFASQVSDAIKEGEVDPLLIHIFLKRIEKVQELLKEDNEIKEAIKKEASKHTMDGKTFDFMGAKITLTSVHTSYDFSSCGDILWENLNEQFNTIKEMKTERESFLKAAFPEKMNKFGFTAPVVVVPYVYSLTRLDCGEEVSLKAPIKRQVEGLRVTFKKS